MKPTFDEELKPGADDLLVFVDETGHETFAGNQRFYCLGGCAVLGQHWLGWTRAFGPVSGFEAKLDRPRERYLSAAFCYGCGLGPTQAARSLKGLDRRHVAFINQRHVTEETLDAAITSVIDAYAAIGLHKHWGSGGAASADGMKWDVHPASLITAYHVRYGGYGGIGAGGGATVTVTGTGFTGATSVRFGASNASAITVVSDTQITATSPAGSGTVDVTVVTPAGTSATSPADQFTYS
jgi:hypothetical protein